MTFLTLLLSPLLRSLLAALNLLYLLQDHQKIFVQPLIKNPPDYHYEYTN